MLQSGESTARGRLHDGLRQLSQLDLCLHPSEGCSFRSPKAEPQPSNFSESVRAPHALRRRLHLQVGPHSSLLPAASISVELFGNAPLVCRCSMSSRMAIPRAKASLCLKAQACQPVLLNCKCPEATARNIRRRTGRRETSEYVSA